MVSVDGVERGVVRHQPHLAVLALEGLDGGLVVEHGRDDVAVVGIGLLPHDDPVPVADGGLDHRVADHLQQEELALADELLGQREDLLDGLLGHDRHTGRDAAQDGDVGRLGAGVTRAGLVERGVVVVGGAVAAMDPSVGVSPGASPVSGSGRRRYSVTLVSTTLSSTISE